MTRVLTVPGLDGSGRDHWQTHLERSLPGAVRVQQSDWDRPELDAWIGRLAYALEASPAAIVVAHSLGCPLVAHLALRRPDLRVRAALLVAPADVDSAQHTPAHIRSFAPIPLARLPFRSVVVASANDPFIGFARARELARAWGAGFVDAGASGHINVEAGFGPWPAGERIVQSLLSEHRPERPVAIARPAAQMLVEA